MYEAMKTESNPTAICFWLPTEQILIRHAFAISLCHAGSTTKL